MVCQTVLMQRLGLAHPIIQAPMAGGATTPDLVAAVCEAGALGFIGAAYLQPSQIREASQAVRARTTRPFGINLFTPLPEPEPPADVRPALARLAPFHAELGLPEPTLAVPTTYNFDEQLAAALGSGASVFSFTFGVLPAGAMRAIRARGTFLIGTATTVEEARQLEVAGVDAVVAQGSEAGAHRGTFTADFEAAMVGTLALVPQVVDAVRVPVIAAGGIMDGRGIAAALALGASAVQLGTAFLTCDEAGVPAAHKEAILAAREHETRFTRAFSGRPARGIVNRLMVEVDRPGAPDAILPYPLQNALTRPLRTAAAKQGRAEFLSLWAGQGVRMARRQSARELIARLAKETDAVIRRLANEPVQPASGHQHRGG
jgi:nitronate monooxygenase